MTRKDSIGTVMLVPSGTGTAAPARHIPGEPGVWLFIFGDMTLFAYAFVLYLHNRGKDLQTFQLSQELLNSHIAVVNTLVLLTSSLLVVLAMRSVRTGNTSAVHRLFGGAILCGLTFVALKVVEYHEEVALGATPMANRFFNYYYFLTVLHLVHVIIGIAILSYLLSVARRATLTRGQIIALEGGTCYWHMVDFLWILIFPLLYLL